MKIRVPGPKKPQIDTLLTGAATVAPRWYVKEKPPRPNWDMYLNLPDVPLNEAVALSLNISPPAYALDGTDRDFDDRMRIAIAHMSPIGNLKHVVVASPARASRVRLVDIALLAEGCTPKWTLPPEFPAATTVSTPKATAAASDGLTSKREKQIRAIEAAAISLGFQVLSIPKNGKTQLRTKCMGENPDLFGGGPDPFNDAWKAASKSTPPRLRMADHNKYSRR